MRLVFEDQGWEDYTSWLKNDRSMLARINKLTEDAGRDPFSGIGKPEPLQYHLPGAWSRRIDDEHRLVCLVTDKEIAIFAARVATDRSPAAGLCYRSEDGPSSIGSKPDSSSSGMRGRNPSGTVRAAVVSRRSRTSRSVAGGSRSAARRRSWTAGWSG